MTDCSVVERLYTALPPPRSPISATYEQGYSRREKGLSSSCSGPSGRAEVLASRGKLSRQGLTAAFSERNKCESSVAVPW